MRLEPGDDQQALLDAVTAVLDDVVTPSSRRARCDGGPLDRHAWSTLGELGVFGVVVPEADGGLGLGVTELCLVLEAVGRSGLSAPVLEASGIVAPLLARVDDDRRDHLDDVLNGRIVVTATLAEHSPVAADATESSIIAVPGRAAHVDLSDRFRLRPQHSLDETRRPVAVEVDGARTVTLSNDDARSLGITTLVANAALLLGISSALLEQTVAYAMERRQFGRPIGSFQAIKHRLADVHVELEASRAAIWAAAVELDECRSPVTPTAAHVAAAVMGEAAEVANDAALQVHGGIGYTWEHDLQIWLKQGLVIGRRLGRPALHRRRAARSAGLLGEPDGVPFATDDRAVGQVAP